MRIIFCGSGTFALPSFQAILAGGHNIVSAITQPARRAGRGGKLTPTPIAEAATAANIDLLECEDINSPQTLAYVQNKEPDIICVIEFGQLIREPIRKAARLDTFNLHGSLLPALRGAGPVNWAILNGLTRTGVCTFSLVDKMDAGPIYHSEAIDIHPEERAGELRERLAELGTKVVLETLSLFATGKAQPTPQDQTKATFAPKLKKSDGYLDFTASAEEIARRVRGCWPWPGGQAVFHHANGKTHNVTITQIKEVTGDCDCPPGEVNSRLQIAAGCGLLEILEIQPAGKKLMPWADFVNGYRIAQGDKFAKPSV